MKEIELKDLCGEHLLTGVDRSNEKILDYGDVYQDCEVLNFTLDGKTYTACENPDDGYRSNMRYLRVTDSPTTNTFAPCKVIGRMKPDYKYGDKNEVLELIDAATGQTVLEVGTANVDDYYPCWVGSFSPENMAINRPPNAPHEPCGAKNQNRESANQ